MVLVLNQVSQKYGVQQTFLYRMFHPSCHPLISLCARIHPKKTESGTGNLLKWQSPELATPNKWQSPEMVTPQHITVLDSVIFGGGKVWQEGLNTL